jgi:hypothetical protein
MAFLRWSVAAAVLLVAVAGIWYMTRSNSGNEVKVLTVKTKPSAGSNQNAQLPPATLPDSGKGQAAEQKNMVADQNVQRAEKEPGSSTTDSLGEINEEMYHYAKIVELRQKELKKIEKEEPLLYRQFSGDVNKLDSVYRSLKKQLNVNPNREQLLEAMIQNLQLQIGLLNHQLEIIKQINHSKKSAYEKAYKSV